MADGSVVIETLIDTSGIKAGSKEVEAAAKRMAASVSEIGAKAKISLQKQLDAFVKLNTQYAAQEKKVRDLKNAIEETKNQKIATNEFSEIGKQIDADSAKLNRLQSAQELFLETGGKESSSAYKRRQIEIEELENSIKYAKAEQDDLLSSGGAYTTPDTSGMEDKLAAESAKLEDMNNRVATSYASVNQKVSEYAQKILEKSQAEEEAAQAEEEAAQAEEEAAQGGSVFEKVSENLSPIVEKVTSSVKHLASSLLKASGKATVSGLKKITRGILGIHKSANKSTLSIGKMFKYLVGIRSLYSLFNKMRSAIKDGFENLAQYSGKTNSSISSLMTALTQLKNSLATAFAPILNTVAPILTKFINMLSAAVTHVGMFIAALTGQKSFTKAVAAQEDYAASLGDTQKNADKAAKALKRYQNPLDQISTYESNSDTSSSGNSGGGYTAPSPSQMFEEVPIESSIKGIADKIKKLIQAEDFEGLGAYIASGINSTMRKIKNAISWDNVGPAVTKFVTAFTKTFNSLVSNVDWNLLGKTIGAGINTIVNSLNLLLNGIDWKNLGTSFAKGVNGLISEVDFNALGTLLGQKFRIFPNVALGFVQKLDWSGVGTALGNALNGVVGIVDLGQIGTTLGTAITGIFQTAITFAQTFDWIQFGTNIASGINGALNSFDFAVIGQGISSLAHGVFQSIITALSTVDWEKFGEDVADFILNVNWGQIALDLTTIGGLLISGLLQGLLAALKSIGTWLKENVFNPIVNWFKKLFGIASPSKVFFEFGKFLIEGLVNGIKNMISLVTGIFTKIWEAIKQSFNAFNTFLTGLFKRDWTKNFGALGEIFNGFFKSLSSIWDDIKKVFSGVIDFITGTFTGNWRKAWNGVKKVFSGVFSGLVDIAKVPLNAIIGAFNAVLGVINGVVDAINSIKFQISLPSWMGGGSWGFNGFNIPHVRTIPYLAKGAVIPPRSEFLAVLGDQKSGNNIEAPESLIRKIVREESGRQSGGNQRLTVTLNRRVIFDEMINEAKVRRTLNGVNPFELA